MSRRASEAGHSSPIRSEAAERGHYRCRRIDSRLVVGTPSFRRDLCDPATAWPASRSHVGESGGGEGYICAPPSLVGNLRDWYRRRGLATNRAQQRRAWPRDGIERSWSAPNDGHRGQGVAGATPGFWRTISYCCRFACYATGIVAALGPALWPRHGAGLPARGEGCNRSHPSQREVSLVFETQDAAVAISRDVVPSWFVPTAPL